MRALGPLGLIAILDAAPGMAMTEGHDMSMSRDDPMDHAMMGALGSYPVIRDASGTSWQPDSSTHSGLHLMEGDWMLMGHSLLNGVYDRQRGPRGDGDGRKSPPDLVHGGQ